MKEVLYGVLFGLAALAVFAVPIGMFNAKMYKANNDVKPTGMELVKCYLPIYHLTYAQKLAYGSATLYTVLICIFCVTIILRIIAVAMVAQWPMGVFITSFLVIFGFLCLIAVMIISGLRFAIMLQCGALTKLFCVILPPLGYYMMTQQVMAYFKSEEDELSGRFGT